MLFFRVRPLLTAPTLFRLFWGVCVLLLGMGLHSLLSHNRTESVMQTLLFEKGGALLSSLESGLRSNRRGGLMRVDFLLEEIAGRPDVQFVALTGPDGFILRHSNPDRIGEVLSLRNQDITPDDMQALAPDQTTRWRVLPMEGQDAFVLYKNAGHLQLNLRQEPEFAPAPNCSPDQAPGREPDDGPVKPGFDPDVSPRHGHRPPSPPPPPLAVPVTLFVGIDPGPLFIARDEDWKRMILTGGGAFACGLLGLFALHWASKARISRQERQAAEALSEKMMLSLPDGLILLDPHGMIGHFNAIACRWLDLREVDIGKPAASVLPPSLASAAAELLAGATLPDRELELPGPDPRPVSVRGGHVETPETGRIGSLLLLRDLSERHRLEAEIRRREKLAAVGNLAAGVAHEIRNPLSSIKGYATYFGERFPEGSDDREAARVMVGEVDRLNRVISDLIDLASPASLALGPTDPAGLVDDTLRLIRQDAARRGIDVRLDCDVAALPHPNLDSDRMRQVVLNLCLNALDAMPHGGVLTWRIKTGGDYLIFEASDTGVGIPPAVLPTIFDPYFTTKGHGTGLGLATVHKIIEAHGGHILVTSMPDQGTTFRLFLPLHPGATV